MGFFCKLVTVNVRVHISVEIKPSFVAEQYESGFCYLNIHSDDGESKEKR